MESHARSNSAGRVYPTSATPISEESISRNQIRRANTFIPADRHDESDDAGSFSQSVTQSFTHGANTVKSLLSFKQARAQADVFAEVTVVRDRIRMLSRGHFNPRGRFVRSWDLTALCAIVYVATVTPAEIALSLTGVGLYGFNRLVDAIFLLDIIFTFFMPYRTAHSKGGLMVTDNRRIAMHYVRGWFFLDLFTTIPFDLILSGVGNDEHLFRALKILRVLKLARIVRASRILGRWQDHISISFGVMSLIKMGTVIILLAHWFACCWALLGDASSDSEYESFADGLSWRQRANVAPDAHPGEVYILCLYVALNSIVGGASDIGSANYVEIGVQSLMLFIGSIMWAYVIGSVCGILATLDPASLEFRQTFDELNLYCSEQKLPSELRARLRSYFRNMLPIMRARRYDRLLSQMSTRESPDTSTPSAQC